LLVSVFGVCTSGRWLLVWIWLELNVLGVLPLVVGAGHSVADSTSSVLYFLVQACGSFLLLTSGLLLAFGVNSGFVCDCALSLGLAVKLGLFPVHFWVVLVSRLVVWWKIALLLVIQKLAPVWLVFSVGCSAPLVWLGLASVVAGSLGVAGSASVKELFSFSSISNSGWLIVSVFLSSSAGLVFFVCYFSVATAVAMVFGFFSPDGVFPVSAVSFWSVVSV